LAGQVAKGLGLKLPRAMPRAIKSPQAAEVRTSSALSLTALPGDGGIATRKVAILVADGVEGGSVNALIDALTAAGAVVRLLGSRLGTVATAAGGTLEVDATLENSPSVLFDALVLPDGAKAVRTLAADGHALEFLKDQYRHCKTIFAVGASSLLLEQAGIAAKTASGEEDPGVLSSASGGHALQTDVFLAAIGKHRHPVRDSDPPMI
jgi:catalase